MMVIMAVMAIFLTVAVETASFQQKREKEEELIFRGNQVVEAIRLFRARFGRFPITLAELVKAKPRVLRKVWKDPITGQIDWVPVYLGEEGTVLKPIPGGLTPTPQPTPQPTPGAGGAGTQGPRGGPIIGVRSPSCDEAVKIYEGHTRYCEWKFFYDPAKLKPGTRPASALPSNS
jgi:type II secretory pathway pseudopilin PulG